MGRNDRDYVLGGMGLYMKWERWKMAAVIFFFLGCGLWYSKSYYNGTLDMGTPAEPAAAIALSEQEAEEKRDEGIWTVNINTAKKEELMLLEGIGEKMADKIIAYRKEYHGFSVPEDIMKVSGIKEKTFEKIKEHIEV